MDGTTHPYPRPRRKRRCHGPRSRCPARSGRPVAGVLCVASTCLPFASALRVLDRSSEDHEHHQHANHQPDHRFDQADTVLSPRLKSVAELTCSCLSVPSICIGGDFVAPGSCEKTVPDNWCSFCVDSPGCVQVDRRWIGRGIWKQACCFGLPSRQFRSALSKLRVDLRCGRRRHVGDHCACQIRGFCTVARVIGCTNRIAKRGNQPECSEGNNSTAINASSR